MDRARLTLRERDFLSSLVGKFLAELLYASPSVRAHDGMKNKASDTTTLFFYTSQVYGQILRESGNYLDGRRAASIESFIKFFQRQNF